MITRLVDLCSRSSHCCWWTRNFVGTLLSTLSVLFLLIAVDASAQDRQHAGGNLNLGADTVEAEVDASALRIPVTEPEDALSTFQVKDGFRLELVASEPRVADPKSLAFDANGRLYTIEMRWYPIIDTTESNMGRIRLLEDTDGDGAFDESTVFADDLRWPTAIFCYDGGVFVASTPELLYLKDTDGDDVADVRRKVATGFGTDRNLAFFVQQMPNSFRWGLDNRIHGVTSGSGGHLASPSGEGNALELGGDDFSFDPRTLQIRKESGGLQHGMSFDDWGGKYVVRQGSHIEQVMYDQRYEDRNPAAVMPNDHVPIPVDHDPTGRVYRLSENEPWRALRTEWWVQGRLVRDEHDDLALQAPGGQRETLPPDSRGYTGGTYFTAASGVTVYRGDAWPDRFRGNAFVGDGAHNIVHRDSLYPNPDGVGMRARRPVDEQEIEFIASTDNWFRPVQFENGPDGALYIADLYREVFDLPSGIPAPIQRQLDLRNGNDRGRIYRIVPEDFEQPEIPRLGEYSTEELVEVLDHPNAWHRETAARLLYERQDAGSVPALDRFFASTDSPLGRVHALYALDGQGALQPAHITAGLGDDHPGVRRHAARLSEQFLGGESQDAAELFDALLALSVDSNIDVRYQVAFSLGETDRPTRIRGLRDILRRNPSSEWIQAAVLSSLAEDGERMFSEIVSDPELSTSEGISGFLSRLTLMIGTQSDVAVVREVVSQLSGLPGDSTQFQLAASLGEGLRRSGSSLSEVESSSLEALLQRAASEAMDPAGDADVRISAIELTGLREDADEILLPLLDADETQEINVAVIGALSQHTGGGLAEKIVERWEVLTPRVRREVVAFLIARPERITVLLDAIEREEIARTELSSSDVRSLRDHSQREIRRRARSLLEWGDTDRQQVVSSYSESVEMEGDPTAGAEIYRQQCARCHLAGDEGYDVGPDLGALSSSKSKLLVDIVDPSRNVPPENLLYTVVTTDGESLSGMISSETTTSITLKSPFGEEEDLLRRNIAEIRGTDRSLMPNGLEVGLSQQDMADLLEFIRVIGEED